MSAAAELTAEQGEAIMRMVEAFQAIQASLFELETLGVDLETALRSVTGEDGSSLWDQLPPMVRMFF